jgi:hypothetical protein
LCKEELLEINLSSFSSETNNLKRKLYIEAARMDSGMESELKEWKPDELSLEKERSSPTVKRVHLLYHHP